MTLLQASQPASAARDKDGEARMVRQATPRPFPMGPTVDLISTLSVLFARQKRRFPSHRPGARNLRVFLDGWR